MRKKLPTLIVFLILLSCLPGKAQKAEQETKSISSKQFIEDSLQVEVLLELTRSNFGENLDSALIFGNQALAKAKALAVEDLIGAAENNLGIARLYQGNNREALTHFYSALESREKMGEKSAIAAAVNNVAIAHQELGNYSIALDFHLRSMKLKEEMGDSARLQVSLNNIGLIYENLKDYNKARDYYLQGLRFPSKFKDSISYATNYSNIGITWFHQKIQDSALVAFERSLAYAEGLNDKRMIGVQDLYIGAIYLQQKQFKKAEDFTQKALQIFEQLGKKDKVVEAWNNLGLIALNRNNPQKAVLFCKKGQELARETGHLTREMECFDCLGKAWKAQGNYPFALEASEEFHRLKDSLDIAEMYKNISRKDMEFAFDSQQLHDSIAGAQKAAMVKENYEKQIQKSERFLLYAIFAGLLLLVLASMLYRNNQQKRRLTRLLEEKVSERTKELEEQNRKLAEYAFINAHLLRGPLTQIMGLVGLIEKNQSPEEREKLIHLLRKSTLKLDKVIHDIRDTVENNELSDGIPKVPKN